MVANTSASFRKRLSPSDPARCVNLNATVCLITVPLLFSMNITRNDDYFSSKINLLHPGTQFGLWPACLQIASRTGKTSTTGSFDKTGDDRELPYKRPRLCVQSHHGELAGAAKPRAHGRVVPVSGRNPLNLNNKVVDRKNSRCSRSLKGLAWR
ncbi:MULTISPECIES: hypothetical protein [Rhizobium/Agrobacterium group]|uniref:hypothetical protein n=1 Tax=Rhizobium/Agrobacterium group TaxID=227290 RepID=UPI001663A62F|nr:hypothetical protein [Rhizobium rhizogenes]